MFYGKLKKTIELITKHLSTEEIIKRKKQLIEEFATPEEFNLPEPEKNKIIHEDRVIHEYKTKLFNNEKEGEIIIKTMIREYQQKVDINYSINNSFDREKRYSTKTTIMIMSVVTLNFLDFFKDFDLSKPFHYNTKKKAISKIDTFLLEMCKKFIPTFKYIEEEGGTYE